MAPTAVLIGVVAAAHASDGQVGANPVATVNQLNSTALVTKPNANMWGGTVSASNLGATISYTPGANGGFQIFNVNKTDLSLGGAVALDVRNSTSQEADFLVSFADAAGNKSQTIFYIPANTTQTVAALESSFSPAAFGMSNLPNPYSGVQQIQTFFLSNANMGQITSVSIYPAGNIPATSLTVSNLRVLPKVNWNSMMQYSVDAYGQSSVYNWAGKLTDPSQFASRKAAEEAGYQRLLSGSTDTYGGSTNLPRQASTGHFYVKKVNGKWWLVDPNGYLYFMNGIDSVEPDSAATTVTGRASLFGWLPLWGDPLLNYYSTTKLADGSSGYAYNFYEANQHRKYGGGNWGGNFVNTSILRAWTWGLNAFGAYTAQGVYACDKMPYTRSMGLYGNYNTVSTGTDLWGAMADPFDSRFVSAVQTAASNYKNLGADPYCIGFVVENEPSWVGLQGTTVLPNALPLGVLGQSAGSSPAKAEFIRNLQAKYSTISRLNTSWGTRYTNWSAMNAPLKFGTTLAPALQTDLSNFLSHYADTYYSTIKSAFKAASPNTLYFGNSFAVNHVNNQVVKIAAKYVDGLSFNIYNPVPESAAYVADTAGLDLPVFANEFNFSSSGEGLYGSLSNQPNQAARAAAYTTFMTAALKDPNFVGANYYKYIDQPTTGETLDGQNCMQGLVDTTDTPYSQMVSAIQAIAQSMYSTRWTG